MAGFFSEHMRMGPTEPGPGERLSTDLEIERFWEPGRVELARAVYEGVHSSLQATFGGEDAPYIDWQKNPKWAFEHFSVEDTTESTRSGAFNRKLNKIVLVIDYLSGANVLARTLAHEVGEQRATRLSMADLGWAIFDEAVIEKETQEALHLELPRVKDDPEPTGYHRAIETLDLACKGVFYALPDEFAYPQEVYRVFQNAVFGGRHDEWNKMMEKAYGEEAMSEFLGLSKSFVGKVGDSGFEIRKNYEKYKALGKMQEILRGPMVLDRLSRAVGAFERRTKRYVVAGRDVKIDYSQVEDGLPMGNWMRRNGCYIPGVQGVVEEVLGYFDSRFAGRNAHWVRLQGIGEGLEVLPDALSWEDLADLGDAVQAQTWLLLEGQLEVGREPELVVAYKGFESRYYPVGLFPMDLEGRGAWIQQNVIKGKSPSRPHPVFTAFGSIEAIRAKGNRRK